eukprot:101625_1
MVKTINNNISKHYNYNSYYVNDYSSTNISNPNIQISKSISSNNILKNNKYNIQSIGNEANNNSYSVSDSESFQHTHSLNSYTNNHKNNNHSNIINVSEKLSISYFDNTNT